MKIGVICEGEKTDGPVLKLLLEAEFPAVLFDIIATTKAVIFQSAGLHVDELFNRGCERVIVIWDLHPVGTQMSVRSQAEHDDPCQVDQRRTLLTVAERSGNGCRDEVVRLQRRYGFREPAGMEEEESRLLLVCFSESFDAIFLSDPSFLRTLASSEIREADDPPKIKSVASVRRPQEVLRQYFRRGHNKRLRFFNKCQHNLVLAQEYIRNGRLAKLRKHPSYGRLISKIAGWSTSQVRS